MKKVWFLGFLAVGCIQTDLEDPFDPTLRIDNSVSEIDFRVSGTYPLNAIYTDDTGEPANAPIVWESSDDAIISFEDNIATVHQEGLVLIRVAANGLSASEPVETLPSRGSLAITGYTPRLQFGNGTPFSFNFIDLQGQTDNSVNVTWASLNNDIATVDENGFVSALSPGTTDISVTFDGVSNAIKLEVSEDPVMQDPVMRIIQFTEFLEEGNALEFRAHYFNREGLVDETATIAWSSTDESVLAVDDLGIASASGPGTASIAASYEGTSASVAVTVESNQRTARTGTLQGTGYDIEGDFTLSNDENGDLILTITNYSPDGPGPYYYLTNQSTNVANGLNLGDAGTAGDITINVSAVDPSVDISTYNFLMIWCEPFNVRLGFGEFDN